MKSRLKLLIAEDNEADLYLIRHSLALAGLDYEAQTAINGEKALAIVDAIAAQPGAVLDGIILDLNLTTHSGLDLLRRVRSLPSLEHTCVVILTSSDSPLDRQQASDLGADAYFRKPIDLDRFMELGTLIAHCLEHRESKSSGGG
jgi:CheY-like chemotaxis protein